MILAQQQLAGRDRELESLARLLAEDGPAAIWLHAVAGSGKTALVRAFARAHPGEVTIVDGGTTEPTEAGFLTALGASRRVSSPSTTITSVSFEVVGADGYAGSYDLIAFFDSLHDMGVPWRPRGTPAPPWPRAGRA